MIKVLPKGNFERMYRDLLIYNPSLENVVVQRVGWFKKNPHDSRLENHALGRKMKGKFAFSITGDIRIIYRWLGKSTARFLAIGSHRQVYKKRQII